MIDYAMVLSANYKGTEWVINGNYDTLVWLSAGTPPTQAELDAQWETVQYNKQVAQVEHNRRVAYETQSDGIFFAWQRGDATELEWREAVAKVKTENPYPAKP
jgi:hypothetical protein